MTNTSKVTWELVLKQPVNVFLSGKEKPVSKTGQDVSLHTHFRDIPPRYTYTQCRESRSLEDLPGLELWNRSSLMESYRASVTHTKESKNKKLMAIWSPLLQELMPHMSK